MTDFEKIKKLRAELEEFLKEHPELQELQDELDRELEGTTSPYNRAAIACSLMVNKWNEIIEANEKLQEAVGKTATKPEKLQ